MSGELKPDSAKLKPNLERGGPREISPAQPALALTVLCQSWLESDAGIRYQTPALRHISLFSFRPPFARVAPDSAHIVRRATQD